MADHTGTRTVARAYFDAWTSRDRAATRRLLADDFAFRTAGFAIDGADAFLDASSFPEDAVTTMLAEAAEGDVAFQLYESRRGDVSVRIVECLRVRDERIRASEVVTDSAAFAAFLEGA